MEVEFLKTQNGYVNTRFVVLLYRPEIGGAKMDYYEVHYMLGAEARSARCSVADGDSILGLTLTV